MENAADGFVLTSTAVSYISCSSNLDDLQMGGSWPYNYCFVGYCFQDLFSISRSILVQLPSSFFSIGLVSVHVMHPYSNIDTNRCLEKIVLSDRSDFHMTDNRKIVSIYTVNKRKKKYQLFHFHFHFH